VGNNGSPAPSSVDGNPSSSNKGSLYSHPHKRGEYKNKKQLPVGLSCVNFVNFRRLDFSLAISFPQQRRHLVLLSLIIGMPSNKNWTTYPQPRFLSGHCLG